MDLELLLRRLLVLFRSERECYWLHSRQGIAALFALTLLASCGPPSDNDEKEPARRLYTNRAIGGASMGAMGASMIGTRHPEHFDAIGAIGGPMDYAHFLDKMHTQYLGGFCSLEDLLALLEANPDNPEILNDREAIAACAPDHPSQLDWEHPASFNNWPFDDSGGSFHRTAYIAKFEDLSLALGNPASYNPESPFFPPGMHEDWTCDEPIVIKGYDSGGTAPIYNAEYNPEGRFDVISFCDGHQRVKVCDATGEVVDFCAAGGDADAYCGEDGPVVRASSSVHPDAYYAHSGRYDPCRPPTERVRFVMAVDLNGNGRRDYGEPIIVNAQERFQDVGAGDAEPYHWLHNPMGTAGNWVYDEGEPFSDHGLDGVPGTNDYGEGTGSFVMSPNIENYFAHDPRTNIAGWSEEDLAGTDIYLDGGVRDILNFGVTSAQVWGLLATLTGDGAAWFDDFNSLPRFGDGSFDFREVDWDSIPRNVFVRYGDIDASLEQQRRGDGSHVGTNRQAVDRLVTHLAWLGRRWPHASRKESPLELEDLAFVASFHSEALGSKREYAIALPPGYHSDENAEKTYPVLYFLHGYGMKPGDFLGYQLLFSDYMASGLMPKMILVYGDGRCCHVNEDDGERDCYLPEGKEFAEPWRRECHRGSFYVNRSGYFHGDDTAYEDSIFDLIRHVESTYRTAVPDWARLD